MFSMLNKVEVLKDDQQRQRPYQLDRMGNGGSVCSA